MATNRRIKSVIIFAILCCVHIRLTASELYTHSDEDVSLSYLLEESDVVVYGRVKELKPFYIELFSESSIDIIMDDASVVLPCGIRKLNREVILRQLGDVPSNEQIENIVGSYFLYFVKDNGKVPAPYPRNNKGRGAISKISMISISSDEKLYDRQGHQLISVSESGAIEYQQEFNKCDINDMPQYEGWILDENGNRRKQTREELLEEAVVFNCPDGSLWRRGNDKPSDYNPEEINIDNLISSIRSIQTQKGFSNSNIKSVLTPKRGPLRKENQDEHPENEKLDKLFLNMLKQQGANSVTQNLIEKIYLREKSRARKNGREEPDFPPSALSRIPSRLISR